MHADAKDCGNADIFTEEGNHKLKMCMWQFFPKELEAVQISHVARNRLQNLVLRHHSFILKSCWTSGILVCLRFGRFCYLILAAVWTVGRKICHIFEADVMLFRQSKLLLI